MSRRKRSSKILESAERRAAGLKSISQALDLGNSLTMAAFTSSIDKVRNRLESYNIMLSSVDAVYNSLLEAEKELSDLSEHMLLGVASRYGKNSDEYEMAGGVRKSERKRPARKATAEAKA